MTQAPPACIEVSGLCKSFAKNDALRDISLRVQTGEIFGLVGPDGAGKTTFIRTLLGLYLPDKGSICVLGATSPDVIKHRIGYVPQQFSLHPDMTVWENIALFSALQQLPPAVVEERGTALLTMVWLDTFKDRLAGQLSGGMKQKLALVVSVMHKPDLLFLDEPTTGVDPVSRREFWQMLYRLNRDGLTILVSTPYMDEVELCTRLAFFHEGTISALGSPADLLKQYPYTLFSIRSPQLRSVLAKLRQVQGENVYLHGANLRVSLPNTNTESLEQSLIAIGLTEYSIERAQPSLEDLFSVLRSE